MTLTDITDTKKTPIDNTMHAGVALRDVLLSAKDQGRLTCGVYDTANLLEINPDNVMLCILPEIPAGDITLHIHFTLIEAFCWENDIRLLRVDSLEKMAQTLGEKPKNDNDVAAGRINRTQDFSCALVEYPDSSSEADEDIVEFYKMSCEASQPPLIELAV